MRIERDAPGPHKEDWYADIPKHVKAFLAKGGKIKQCAEGESGYKTQVGQNPSPLFTINHKKEAKIKPRKNT